MGNSNDSMRAALIHAIEANSVEFFLAMGRAIGAEERQTPAIHWIIGSSPADYHNCVVRADLSPATVDAAISASIERFQAHGVSGSWHVGPWMRPDDLGTRLAAHGFVHDSDDIGMAVWLDRLAKDSPGPAGLTIERVVDEAGLAAWTAVAAPSFLGDGEPETAWIKEVYRRLGLTGDVPWRHYVGSLDGEPVATATLFVGGGAAGVYFVATLPAARRRGIGAALTLAALRDGRALGEQIGVLGASEAGYSVYRRLGFEALCRIGIYEWRRSNPEGIRGELRALDVRPDLDSGLGHDS
ncbi:MAG: GNAT family N-acetyltransferase [Chloroflexota bacterium]|nr:GNAT family N-acetyltransferase [Chloroflexota bacterium]